MTVSSSFSRKVRSVASPGRRHSSSCRAARKVREYRGHHVGSHRHRKKGQHLSLPCPSPHSDPVDTRKEGGGFPTVSQHEASRAEDTHQDGDDALEFLLHQVTDDLVVEVLDRFPLHRMRRAAIIGFCTFSREPQCLVSHDTQGTPAPQDPRHTRTAMPSASYSSCSDLRVSSMKSCCSFSLQ